eukprot:COSAG01_NODE_6235_length_3776_cov_48.658961_5_plen_123_part_00
MGWGPPSLADLIDLRAKWRSTAGLWGMRLRLGGGVSSAASTAAGIAVIEPQPLLPAAAHNASAYAPASSNATVHAAPPCATGAYALCVPWAFVAAAGLGFGASVLLPTVQVSNINETMLATD